MRLDDRIQALLESVLAEERLRHRSVAEGAAFLGESPMTTYKRIASGELGHVKVPGGERKGRGQAGAVRVRLIDLIEWSVRNEHRPGKGPRSVPNEEPAAKAGGGVHLEP
jgi:hypothetical protein